jgi:hypothetical protein
MVPVSWGYSAQQKYNRLPPAQRPDHKFMTRFKLLLDEEYARTHDAPDDGPVPIIGDYLSYLKKAIIDVLRAKFGSSFSMDRVHWCLTVMFFLPSRWIFVLCGSSFTNLEYVPGTCNVDSTSESIHQKSSGLCRHYRTIVIKPFLACF